MAMSDMSMGALTCQLSPTVPRAHDPVINLTMVNNGEACRQIDHFKGIKGDLLAVHSGRLCGGIHWSSRCWISRCRLDVERVFPRSFGGIDRYGRGR